MKELYKVINEIYFKLFTTRYWEQAYFSKDETNKIIYEYFQKNKDDLIKDLKYEYELNEGIKFEKILEYNPYKFKKNMKPDEIYIARCQGSDKTQMSVAQKYLNKEVLNSNHEYDEEKIMKLAADFQEELDEFIDKYIRDSFHEEETGELQHNQSFQQLFYKSDFVAVDDKNMTIYPVFKNIHYTTSISNSYFKSNAFPYATDNIILDPKAISYVDKEARRIRLENNGPEVVDNESFAKWIGRGYNDDILNEYARLYENINFGGLYYLKEVIESSKEMIEYQDYKNYRVIPIIVLYSPMTENRWLFTYNYKLVYMNTDFSQVKELQGKYQ